MTCGWRLVGRAVFLVGGCLSAVGCGLFPPLPESLEVATSATERVVADAGTGPAGLADSVWSISRQADPQDGTGDDGRPPLSGPYGGLLNGEALERPPVGERIFLIHFGENGQMTRVTENRYFLREFYGSEVAVEEEWYETTIQGAVYQGASYGVQEGDRFGLAAELHVRLATAFLARAVFYSWGTTSGDHIEGTFGYMLDFTDGVLPEMGIIADQYPVEGERVEP